LKDKSNSSGEEFIVGTSEGTVKKYSLVDSEISLLNDKVRKE